MWLPFALEKVSSSTIILHLVSVVLQLSVMIERRRITKQSDSLRKEVRKSHDCKRGWLLFPIVIASLVDATLTLLGQSEDYWSGDYSLAHEYNPIVHPFLAASPWLFIGFVLCWIGFLSFIVFYCRASIAKLMMAFVTLAHAIGASSWLVRWGILGWVTAVVLMASLAELMRMSWEKVQK